ncbi:MAG: nitroreductase/quinone reductase family protein, partial [Ilumatobacteraceae bacterium]
MSATEPSISPWPAPNPADAATPPPAPTRRSGLHQLAAGVLEAARRVLDPEVRAEHLAVKEEQRITEDLDDLPCGWFVSPLADVEIVMSGASRTMRARVTEGVERTRLWEALTAKHANYAGYQRKTSR